MTVPDAEEKTIPIFFVVDASKSAGQYLTPAILRNLIWRITDIVSDSVSIRVSESGGSVDSVFRQLKPLVAVLSYGEDWRWVTDGLVDTDVVSDLAIDFSGVSGVGLALAELNKRLSIHALLRRVKRMRYAPIICFVSDGKSTGDYKTALNLLRENPWFSFGTKIGICLSERKELLKDLTGSMETCMKLDDWRYLERVMIIDSVALIRDYYSDYLELPENVKRELRI